LPRSCWLLHALLAFASSSSRATASLPLSPTRRSSDLADQQQGRSPDIAQGNETLPPGGLRPPRQQIGPQRPQEADRNDVEQNGEQPGQDAGDEQLADILLGQDAVEGEDHRRWNHDAQRTAGGNDA